MRFLNSNKLSLKKQAYIQYICSTNMFNLKQYRKLLLLIIMYRNGHFDCCVNLLVQEKDGNLLAGTS